ncbi:hypothetical protein KQX54_010762 [Cotesia glomerata]|uniref:Uncharacterized protein n=1 Tax=Cotesia glomerata TaxID=32391 RepID=A0AAV7IGT2_COTGL|nr:hypothetical protein KQX54_010762 [Cotesia glomerata]
MPRSIEVPGPPNINSSSIEDSKNEGLSDDPPPVNERRAIMLESVPRLVSESVSDRSAVTVIKSTASMNLLEDSPASPSSSPGIPIAQRVQDQGRPAY